MIGSSICLRSWSPRYEIVHRKEPESRLHPWNVRVSRSRIALITHAPVWGERALIPLEQRYKWLQLTPPRGGERMRHSYAARQYRASTHAPAWRRTGPEARSELSDDASTHAPVWGRTRTAHHLPEASTELQLTPPGWGANSGPSSQRCQQPVFNSRPWRDERKGGNPHKPTF